MIFKYILFNNLGFFIGSICNLVIYQLIHKDSGILYLEMFMVIISIISVVVSILIKIKELPVTETKSNSTIGHNL
jgi:Na+/melibiose symporter-like transporter